MQVDAVGAVVIGWLALDPTGGIGPGSFMDLAIGNGFLDTAGKDLRRCEFRVRVRKYLWLPWKHLQPGRWNGGILLQVLFGQLWNGVADVDLAGYDIGDEASAVLVHGVNLFVGLSDGIVEFVSGPAEIIDDIGLFVNWRNWETDVK